MNILNNGFFIGLCLAILDIISMGMVKNIYLKNIPEKLLIIAVVLYGIQMLIFYHGMLYTSMTVLNLTWNLISSIIVTLIGIYYFKENISNLETYGVLFGLLSLFLFGLSKYENINK